jgi:iron(II)-dependent oxidoreductase
MRIGISFLSFGKDVFAGIENSLYNLALGLRHNGASVHIFSSGLSGSEASVDGIPVHRSSLLPSTLPNGDETVRAALATNREAIRTEMAAFVRERAIDVLYVCDPLWGIAQETAAWEVFDCPMLLSLRVLNTADLLTNAKRSPFRLYTAVSASLKEQVLHYVELSPMAVIPNSINVQHFQPYGNATSTLIVFCNSRISPEKGVIDLVLSFPKVVQSVQGAELWLCAGAFPFGDPGKSLRAVQNAVADLRLQHCVRFLPKLRWCDIPSVIHQAAVVVLPSHSETFGRGALEGMACGKPVVATRVGNLPSLVGDAGILVPPESPDCLSEAIITLLKDTELRTTLGSRGVDRATPFSNERIAAELLRQLNSITQAE